KVRLWDVTSGKELRVFPANRGGEFFVSLAVSSDDKLVAAGGSYAGVFLWNLEDGKNQRVMPLEKQMQTQALAFSPDNQRLVAGAADGSVYVFQVKDGKLLSRTRVTEKWSISALQLLPDGKRVVLGSLAEPRAVLWDLEKGEEIRRYQCKDPVESL